MVECLHEGIPADAGAVVFARILDGYMLLPQGAGGTPLGGYMLLPPAGGYDKLGGTLNRLLTVISTRTCQSRQKLDLGAKELARTA